MNATRWILGGFCGGVVLALAARAAPVAFDAYLDASRARYDLMTAEPAGNVSYLISYDDYATLASLAATENDIVAVNAGNFAGVGRITFRDADSPSIERVRRHPNTAFILNTTLPLICH